MYITSCMQLELRYPLYTDVKKLEHCHRAQNIHDDDDKALAL